MDRNPLVVRESDLGFHTLGNSWAAEPDFVDQSPEKKLKVRFGAELAIFYHMIVQVLERYQIWHDGDDVGRMDLLTERKNRANVGVNVTTNLMREVDKFGH